MSGLQKAHFLQFSIAIHMIDVCSTGGYFSVIFGPHLSLMQKERNNIPRLHQISPCRQKVYDQL